MGSPLQLLLVCMPLALSTDVDPAIVSQIQAMQPAVDQIVQAVTAGEFKGQAWQRLADFTDTVGNRIAGSAALDMGIEYLEAAMKADGLTTHTEPAMVPHWERGNEWAVLKTPLIGGREYHLKLTGLGRSSATPEDGLPAAACVWGGGVGTVQQLHAPGAPGRADPRCGIEADVVVIETFEELEARGVRGELQGKILVASQEWTGYGGGTNAYRRGTAVEGAKWGAVGALVRSVAPWGLSNPHTGGAGGADGTPVPTAAIAISDAHMLLRMQKRGQPLRLQLYMEGQNFADVLSFNTVGDLPGSEKPEELVLVSGHLDSWDVGFGAMDDGGGVFISWQAVAVLKKLGLTAKRTVRAVGWTCEEMGGGARAFWDDARNDPADYSLVMESDSGVFDPRGIQFSGSVEAHAILREVGKLLPPRLGLVTAGGEGADIGAAMREGAPGASLLAFANRQWNGPMSMETYVVDPVTGQLTEDPSHGKYGKDEYHFQGDYFFYHHSDADTMEILDPAQMDRAVALWASFAYVVANLDDKLPRMAPGEAAPSQAELDELFGVVDLGVPAECAAFVSSVECSIGGGSLFLAVLVAFAVGTGAAPVVRMIGSMMSSKNGFSKIDVETQPINRDSNE
jgi:carboxypeptidase Q